MPALGFGAVAGGAVSGDAASAPIGVLVNPYAEEAVIYEFSYTSGTGTYALAGGWSTHLPLSARYPGGATGITYYVKDGSTGAGSQFEVGIGDYDAVGKTLSRLSILASSNNNQLVDWSGRTRLLIRPLFQGIPLCSTPPLDGQVLTWVDADKNYCPRTPGATGFSVGAVWPDLGFSTLFRNLPAMVDSSSGTLSLWIYTTQSQIIAYRCDGDVSAGSGYIINDGPGDFYLSAISLPPAFPGNYLISNISNEPRAVISFSGFHDLTAGTWITVLNLGQSGWFPSGNLPVQVVANGAVGVLAPSVIVDWDTTALPAYNPAMNPAADIDILNAFDFWAQDLANVNSYFWTGVQPMPHDQWVNVLCSWDMNQAAGQKLFNLYFTDQSAPPAEGGIIDTSAAFVIPYSNMGSGGNVWNILGTLGSFAANAGYFAEYWFAPGVYIDFTAKANRLKFHDESGRPVSLGALGELPTGSPPTVYLTMPRNPASPSDWALNAAGSGPLTIQGGAPFLAPKSPTDT